MALSIQKQIEAQVKKSRKGSFFFPSDFVHVGGTEAVKKSLLRLEEKGILKRAAFGIYVHPKTSELLGALTPTLDEIAHAIAERDKARIVPTGSQALHALGMSTQMPLNAVYLTDGAQRTVAVGKRNILFKKTTPRVLSTQGIVSSLVIQALKAIGNGKVSAEEEQKVIELLKKESLNHIMHDLSLAPEWIRKIMRKAIPYAHQSGIPTELEPAK